VSTTGRDADWIVKVIDEYPVDDPGYTEARRDAPEPDLRGVQRLVRAEVFRGRFRKSYENPEPFEPGEVTRVTYELRDVLHTFRRGHRITIQVQSSWFPFVDRNPQSWVENIFEAEEEDFIRATHRVHRSPEHPSRVRVGVLDP
jgi:predicted acyl esterase